MVNHPGWCKIIAWDLHLLYNNRVITVNVTTNFGNPREGTVFISGCGIDNSFVVKQASSCTAPQFFNVERTTPSSVKLRWTPVPGVSHYEIRYDSPAGQATILINPSDSVEIGGLTPSQEYLFYFRAVCGTNLYSEWVSSSTLLVDVPLTEVNDIKIYPNPTDRLVYIQCPGKYKNLNLIITDNLGQQIFSKSLESDLEIIDLSGHPPGIYLFKIFSGKISVTDKVVLR